MMQYCLDSVGDCRLIGRCIHKRLPTGGQGSVRRWPTSHDARWYLRRRTSVQSDQSTDVRHSPSLSSHRQILSPFVAFVEFIVAFHKGSGARHRGGRPSRRSAFIPSSSISMYAISALIQCIDQRTLNRSKRRQLHAVQRTCHPMMMMAT